MKLSVQGACVLNGGSGSWAFEPLAIELASCLGVEVASVPRRFNYLMHLEEASQADCCNLFIPLKAIKLAADKRKIAAVFLGNGVPSPRTHLIDSFEEVLGFIRQHPEMEWCLKYPTGCGANGHRLVTAVSSEPANWPRPFVLQEFIRLEQPEVYRTYCVAGHLFGWVARRFPEGKPASPWVAHARGARYVSLGEPPSAAMEVARGALVATQLWGSFGCVDLLRRASGEWVALEVGTDGLYNHVDRDLDDAVLEQELKRRIASAFWEAANKLAGG